MGSPQVLVRLERVRVTLNSCPALAGVSLELGQGERVVLQGGNGAGKSTLLRVLRGELYPDQKNGGLVAWFPGGSSIGDSAPLTGRAMSSIVSPRLQEIYVRNAWRVTALELILAGIYDAWLLYREPTAGQIALVRQLAARLGAEQLLGQALPRLSQGELRLVLLLRALIRQPEILLLDEADEGLDERSRAAFFAALDVLLADSPLLAVVLASHRRAPDFTTRTIHLADGRLSAAPPDPRPMSVWEPTGGKYPGIMVSLRNCDVYLDQTLVLNQINLDLERGQSWLLGGPNGSGKTTLLRLIAGEESPALGGEIFRVSQGRKLVELTEIQKKIRLVSPRLQSLYPAEASVLEVVLSGLDGSIGLWREPDPDELEQARAMLRLAGLESLSARAFGSLSSGQMRKTLFTRALLGQPALLLLDEPFAGLDSASRTRIRRFLRDRLKDGLQIILVSHYQEDLAADIPNRAVLAKGRLTILPAEPACGRATAARQD